MGLSQIVSLRRIFEAPKEAAKYLLAKAGYRLVKNADMDAQAQKILEQAGPYTMTSKESILALRDSVNYIVSNQVPGDIVECGVWRGGSMMACALTLLGAGERRTLWLYDTFEGMTPPGDADVFLPTGEHAGILLNADNKRTSYAWACCPLEEVKANLESTGYPKELIRYVKGPVEKTIPRFAPKRIALLRLDTDWYQSSYHELVHLYPRLSPRGVLIIDDYGAWAGSQKATDQYFAENGLHPLLHRVDARIRMVIKEKAAPRLSRYLGALRSRVAAFGKTGRATFRLILRNEGGALETSHADQL
jgi:hypothetical protein